MTKKKEPAGKKEPDKLDGRRTEVVARRKTLKSLKRDLTATAADIIRGHIADNLATLDRLREDDPKELDEEIRNEKLKLQQTIRGQLKDLASLAKHLPQAPGQMFLAGD